MITPLSESPFWDAKTQTYDWDAEQAEFRRKNPPPVLHAFGEEVELPYSTPVKVLQSRERRNPEDPLTVDILLEELHPLVGARVDVWIDEHSLGIDDLVELVRSCGRAQRDAAAQRNAVPKPKKGKGKNKAKA